MSPKHIHSSLHMIFQVVTMIHGLKQMGTPFQVVISCARCFYASINNGLHSIQYIRVSPMLHLVNLDIEMLPPHNLSMDMPNLFKSETNRGIRSEIFEYYLQCIQVAPIEPLLSKLHYCYCTYLHSNERLVRAVEYFKLQLSYDLKVSLAQISVFPSTCIETYHHIP